MRLKPRPNIHEGMARLNFRPFLDQYRKQNDPIKPPKLVENDHYQNEIRLLS